MKTYETPTQIVVVFTSDDVVTTSSAPYGTDNVKAWAWEV